MSRTAAALPSAPRPKVFRPPAALRHVPAIQHSIGHSEFIYSGRLWRTGVLLLALGLVWSVPHNQATASFTRDTAALLPANHTLAAAPQPQEVRAKSALMADNSSTIMLRGRSESIIGQMAKIPAESEPVIEVKPASEVDNNVGSELLSIISKY